MQVLLELLRRYGILLIVVVVIVGFVVFRDRLPGAAQDLQVGECFDRPAATTDISEVQRQPCNEAHDGEVFLVVDHPAASGEVYPISLTIDRYLDEQCSPAFDSYTGLDYENEPDLAFSALIPSRESWNDDDREVTCYLLRTDGTKLTASLRAATQ